MVMDVNQTYSGDYFTTCTCIKTLCCIPETTIMSYTSIKTQTFKKFADISIFNNGFPGEGNGTPLQYSCLENPMDRGAWKATVHGIARVRHGLVLSFLFLSDYI